RSATAVAALRKSQARRPTPVPSSARAQRATRSGGHPIASTTGVASAGSVEPWGEVMTVHDRASVRALLRPEPLAEGRLECGVGEGGLEGGVGVGGRRRPAGGKRSRGSAVADNPRTGRGQAEPGTKTREKTFAYGVCRRAPGGPAQPHLAPRCPLRIEPSPDA